MSVMERQRGDGEVAICHMCGKTFSSQETLSKHLMDVHDEEGLATETPTSEAARGGTRGGTG